MAKGQDQQDSYVAIEVIADKQAAIKSVIIVRPDFSSLTGKPDYRGRLGKTMS